MVPILRIKRGTRTQLDSAAIAVGLNVGELYLITDEDRLAVGTAVNRYKDFGGLDFDGGFYDSENDYTFTIDMGGF